MKIAVIAEVTALAHGPQVIVVAVLWHMVQVRHGEDNLRAGYRVWGPMNSSAPMVMLVEVIISTFALAFAPTPSTV